MKASQPVTIHRRGAPVLDAQGNQTYDEYGNPVYGAGVDLASSAIRIAPVGGEEISIDRQTHIVDSRGAFPPGVEHPLPTDELTFVLNGHRPVRCRVLAVLAVPCPRRNAVKYVRVDMESV